MRDVVRSISAPNANRQAEDYYATDPAVAKLLLEIETFRHVWEPACGEGHISKILEASGLQCRSTDLVDRGFGTVQDFLLTTDKWDGDIITNPPYKLSQEFVLHSLRITNPGAKIALLMKIQFLESKIRRKMFEEHPPKTIWISSSRINCAKNGDFEAVKLLGGTVQLLAWFVWENGFKGTTELKWFN